MKELIEERLRSLERFFRLNPRVNDFPDRFSYEYGAVRLLVMGSISQGCGGYTRIEIEETLASPAAPQFAVESTASRSANRRHRVALGIAFLLGAAVIGVAVRALRIQPPAISLPVSRLVMAL